MFDDSFAMVDQLLDKKSPIKEVQPVVDTSIKTPQQFDILQHLLNKEHRKQELINQHHHIAEKLSRRHIHESPLQHKSYKSHKSKITKSTEVSPMKSIETVSTLKRFDSKFENWPTVDIENDIDTPIVPSHVPTTEHNTVPTTEHIVYNDTVHSVQNTPEPFPNDHFTNIQVDPSKIAIPMIECATQVQLTLHTIDTQTINNKCTEIGIQTDIDYFDPLLSFSKLSIEKELKKPLPTIEKNYNTPKKTTSIPSTPIKKLPEYKKQMIERFLQDVVELVNSS